MGTQGFGIAPNVISRIADEVSDAHNLGIQVAVVVGGGNIFRGVQGSEWGMDKAAADYVGMLATIMNALILQEVLNSKQVPTRVQQQFPCPKSRSPLFVCVRCGIWTRVA